MSETRGYGSPAAFRRALTDKLRAKAETSQWTLQQLQRQMAYDRLLERLYLVDDGWVVKGATALLARDIGVRATIDIDVYRETARDEGEAELRAAAVKDIADWFTFELGASRPVAAGAPGVRIPVRAFIGPTVWASFNVDLVGSDLRMTGEPDPVPPLARVVMPDVEQHGFGRTRSSITLPTRSWRLLNPTATGACRRRGSRISWTWSRSCSAPRWPRSRS